MKIGITGGTGFIGRYIIQQCLNLGFECRAWKRPASKLGWLSDLDGIEWIDGQLNHEASTENLVQGCDAIIHAALFREGAGFRGTEGNLIEFTEKNVIGSLRLIEASIAANVPRFVFVSTCAVHEKILDDRPLDETHPLWPLTHYGAHKAAIEKFVHSYGYGMDYPISAVRPTGVYGVNHPKSNSKWFTLIDQVIQGEPVACSGGGKEVHASDVAKAATLLVQADAKSMSGRAFSCYDRYVSQYEVASIAKELSGSISIIDGEMKSPKHQIETGAIRSLGMKFGGDDLLRSTIAELVEFAQAKPK